MSVERKPEVKAAPIHAAEIIRRLRVRYEYPEWLVADELTLDYQGKTFRADAMAVNLWVSNKLHIHGFEVKVSRSDWLKELQQVGKCEAARRFCDRWWLVSPPDIADKKELPEGWGWIQTWQGKLKAVKQAAQNDNPDKFNTQLIIRLIRAGCEKSPVVAREKAEANQRIEQARTSFVRAGGNGAELERLTKDNAALKAERDELRAVIGISPHVWNPAETMAMVKALRERRHHSLRYAVEAFRRASAETLPAMEELLRAADKFDAAHTAMFEKEETP